MAGARRVLVAAGLDPSGRAGLLADVATLQGLRVQPLAVVTALTAQGTRSFAREEVPPRLVGRQLAALAELAETRGLEIDAVKLGMVPSAKMLQTLVSGLGHVRTWVVDPVVMTSRGEPLSELEPKHYFRLAKDLGKKLVLTPNLPELRWLTGEEDVERGTRALLERGVAAVVLKGGHGSTLPRKVIDRVVTATGTRTLQVPMVKRTEEKRGTGCRHASALAAGLVNGQSLHAAARGAQKLVARYLIA